MGKQNKGKNGKKRQRAKSLLIEKTRGTVQNPSFTSQANNDTSYSKHVIWLSWTLYWLSGLISTAYAASSAWISFINTFVLLNAPAELCSTWPCSLDFAGTAVFFILLLLSSWLLFVQLPQYLVQRKTFNPAERIMAAITLFFNVIFVLVCRVAAFQTFLRMANVAPTARIPDIFYFIFSAVAIIWCFLLTLRYTTSLVNTSKSDSSFRSFTNTTKQKSVIYNKISRWLSEEEIEELERLLHKTERWRFFSIESLVKIAFFSLVIALFYAILEELITRL